jgi:hypothetical protein
MYQHGTWSPYTGSGSLVLAVVMFIITGVLIYVAMRMRHSRGVKRPGAFVSILLIVIWVLSVLAFLIGSGAYALALSQQVPVSDLTLPANPITPVTMSAAVLAFLVILVMAQRGGPKAALVSALVGTIAAPMIFEFPFDLIVMWRTFPPHPGALFTLIYFVPLFLIEITSFAWLSFSPLMKLSRYTLFCLAGMFLVFAAWALFGFAYPLDPLSITFNVISKLLAFAVAVSLFLPQKEPMQPATPLLPEESLQHPAAQSV